MIRIPANSTWQVAFSLQFTRFKSQYLTSPVSIHSFSVSYVILICVDRNPAHFLLLRPARQSAPSTTKCRLWRASQQWGDPLENRAQRGRLHCHVSHQAECQAESTVQQRTAQQQPLSRSTTLGQHSLNTRIGESQRTIGAWNATNAALCALNELLLSGLGREEEEDSAK